MRVVHNNWGWTWIIRRDRQELGEIPDEDSDLSGTDSEYEIDDEKGVWARSRVNLEAYERRMAM